MHRSSGFLAENSGTPGDLRAALAEARHNSRLEPRPAGREPRGTWFFRCVSEDGGEIWSEPATTHIGGPEHRERRETC